MRAAANLTFRQEALEGQFRWACVVCVLVTAGVAVLLLFCFCAAGPEHSIKHMLHSYSHLPCPPTCCRSAHARLCSCADALSQAHAAPYESAFLGHLLGAVAANKRKLVYVRWGLGVLTKVKCSMSESNSLASLHHENRGSEGGVV